MNQGSVFLKERGVVLLLTFPAPLLRLPAAFLVLHLEAVGSLRELMQLSNSAKLVEFSLELGKRGSGQRGLSARACLGRWVGLLGAGRRVEGGRFLLPTAASVLKLLVFISPPPSVLNHTSLLFVVQESI